MKIRQLIGSVCFGVTLGMSVVGWPSLSVGQSATSPPQKKGGAPKEAAGAMKKGVPPATVKSAEPAVAVVSHPPGEGVASAAAKSLASAGRRSRLPRDYAKLGLDDEQKSRIQQLQQQYEGTLRDLRQQLAKMRADRDQEIQDVLTATQREHLQQLARERQLGIAPQEDTDKSPTSAADMQDGS